MREICGLEAIDYLEKGGGWMVDNRWFVDEWMCKFWEPLYNPLEEELVTVMCNNNTYHSFDNTEDGIRLRTCNEYYDVDYSVGLTPQQWLKLHEQAMKIIDLKKRVDEVEE